MRTPVVVIVVSIVVAVLTGMFFFGGENSANTLDSDGDGLTDQDEINAFGTDPQNSDTDGDLLPDGLEVRGSSSGMDPLTPNNPNADSDGDGVSDLDEITAGTDPLQPDTDSGSSAYNNSIRVDFDLGN